MGPHTLRASGATRDESQGYLAEIVAAIRAAGWTVNKPPLRIVEREGTGVQLFVRDLKTAPEGAAGFQEALRAVGIDANGYLVQAVAEGEFELNVAAKPRVVK